MDLGFETCGNASLIVYDHGAPVVVTDPWISEAQYFGSWTLPYRFTERQLDAFARVPYVWVSHGHPDHLNLPSLERFRDRIILVPRHHGGRIAADLTAAGFRVEQPASGEWLQLAERVRILSAPDWNQDAALLLALGGDCAVLNLNDGSALGTRARLKEELRRFRRRFVLGLINYGDADMMNYFTESGERIVPLSADQRPLGHLYSGLLKDWDGTHTAPFSCHHMYARTDSAWARAYETPLEAHRRQFNPARGEFLDGFFAYDALADRVDLTPVERVPRELRPPEDFGDNWSEPLEAEDVQALRSYFGRFEHLRACYEFINFRVGGRDALIGLGGPRGRGITFEAPRGSLMSAVRYEIFDDLLIGNFMRTTLHGAGHSLYPDFTPYVAKYGDNGRAFTDRELQAYFEFYGRPGGLHGWLERTRAASGNRLRRVLAANRPAYNAARRVYRYLKA